MQEKDKVSNRYLEDPARFADIVNVQLYEGEPVLGAENIKERKNTNRYIERNTKGFHSYTVERDIVREAELESHVVLIAVENQSGIHYAMPARVMQGDALCYHEQMNDIAKKHKEKKDLKGEEYISQFSKEDKLIPVTTICIYWGTKPWDGPRSLKDMLKLQGMSEEQSAKFADYPLNLIEVNTYENVEAFKTDLRLVFGFLQRRENAEELRGFLEKNMEEMETLAEDAIDLLSVMANMPEIDEMKKDLENEEGGYDMCKGIRDMIKEGEVRGKNMAINVIKLNIAGKGVREISDECKISEKDVQEILTSFAG